MTYRAPWLRSSLIAFPAVSAFLILAPPHLWPEYTALFWILAGTIIILGPVTCIAVAKFLSGRAHRRQR